MTPFPPTITAAAGLLRRGDLTPTALLEQCLARVDRYEPEVRAWVVLDRDGARAQAQRLTNELKQGKDRGPLHGIPIGIKDIFDVFDLPTGCGSRLWANSYARRDATCVERLRMAGAVIMGKTVTTPYASFDPAITRNPWNRDRTPGGSSSGSAAAVACGMCLGALASQTGGSITRPAAYCGVCSLKPTRGRVSVDGVLPLAPSLDHVGIMANCVRDLAILFQVIAGPDPRSPETLSIAAADVVDLIDRRLEQGQPRSAECEARSENQGAFRAPPRFERLRGFFEDRAEPAMREAMDRFCRRAASLDLEVAGESPAALPASFADIHTHHRRIMAVEAAAYHAGRMMRHPHDYPPRVAELISEGVTCAATDYADSLAQQFRARMEIAMILRAPDLYVVTPATSGPAPGMESTGNPVMNSPWSFTGLPVASLPIGWTEDGMPLSVQITGPSCSEGSLLAAAAWCERTMEFPRREIPA